jgi:hypothetical protein
MRGSASRPEYERALGPSGTGFKGTVYWDTYVNGILWCLVYHSIVDDHTLDDEQIKYGL